MLSKLDKLSKFTFQYGATNINYKVGQSVSFYRFTFQYGATNIRKGRGAMVLEPQFTFQYGATNIIIKR